jgi:TorA maturation chaperone TorD
MKNSSYLNQKTQIFSDIYSWATLALSHPKKNCSIADTLEILEEIKIAAGRDSDIDLSKELEELSGDQKIRQLDLLFFQQEHSRLFIGPFSLLAPPYESYYSGKHTLMGQTSSNVEKFYHCAGMAISPDFKDAPDHIILETEFLARLCEMEAAALEKSEHDQAAALRELQLAFLEKHLLTWINALQVALENSASSRFYPVIVKIIQKTAKNHYLGLQNTGDSDA